MNQPQQNPRYAADRAFIESLNQLQWTLQTADKPVQPVAPPTHSSRDGVTADSFDLNSFEQAVADIEAFIQKRQEDGGRGE